ncbi:glycosyltransferase family 2 protein [uncultured Desulfobacter sp.]|uniref:glycosyltransferase family 2 protein n=1 Tax=uncultured Desulfobacter sp. TaxID=240139 RepID=UPI002AA7D611|nr:glycosyltransferase family 2 protein [uncultured Desulfobacter sp.]
MTAVSAYIIAYNEAEKIQAAVESVLWADDIVVADSYSTDDTAAIAGELGARVVQIPFNGFGDLRNQAVAACRHEWIFSLDADERCTADVRDEILGMLQQGPDADVYFVPRRNYFMGRWIKHSGFYPDYRQPQFFRRGAMSYCHDRVHEGFELHGDAVTGYLQHAIWQLPFKNFEEIQHKASRYSTLGAERMMDEGRTSCMGRALRHALWSFTQHYFLKNGWRDGWPGFVIALGNFEGTFYKYAKRYQALSDWCPPPTTALRRPVPGS